MYDIYITPTVIVGAGPSVYPVEMCVHAHHLIAIATSRVVNQAPALHRARCLSHMPRGKDFWEGGGVSKEFISLPIKTSEYTLFPCRIYRKGMICRGVGGH